MSYVKNLEEGIILQLSEYGESGKILKILTQDGIKTLVATGVRELYSKMRGEIDVLMKVQFEFVEGKEVRRLVGIFPEERLFQFYGENILQKRKVISNVVNFILRTVVGETENEKLYEVFSNGLKKLVEQKNRYDIFEIIWLSQILFVLGYWEENIGENFSEENFSYIGSKKDKVIEEINQAILSTHM